jgi:uncharacterized protein YjbJ (UPF0337 family)
MQWEQIQATWHEYKGQILQHWGALTDNDMVTIDGRRDELADRIQERTGVARELVEIQIAEFEAACLCATPAAGTP